MHIVIWALIPYALLNIAVQVQADSGNENLKSTGQRFLDWRKQVNGTKAAKKSQDEKSDKSNSRDADTGNINKEKKPTDSNFNGSKQNAMKGSTEQHAPLAGGNKSPTSNDRSSPTKNSIKQSSVKPSNATQQKANSADNTEILNKGSKLLRELIKGEPSMENLLKLNLVAMTFKYNPGLQSVTIVATVHNPTKYLIFHKRGSEKFQPCIDLLCFNAMRETERHIQRKRLDKDRAEIKAAQPSTTQKENSTQKAKDAEALKTFEGKGIANTTNTVPKPADLAKKAIPQGLDMVQEEKKLDAIKEQKKLVEDKLQQKHDEVTNSATDPDQ